MAHSIFLLRPAVIYVIQKTNVSRSALHFDYTEEQMRVTDVNLGIIFYISP